MHNVMLMTCREKSVVLVYNIFMALTLLCTGSIYSLTVCICITESQNNRMLGVGRDLCGSSSPIPLPKQGHLEQAAQHCICLNLTAFKDGDPTSSLGNMIPC